MKAKLSKRTLRMRGEKVRTWEKGRGRPLGVLSGLLGFPAWTPFLEALSSKRRVIVPSLPGHPGGGDFRRLDDLADWVIATQELLEAAGLAGADLVGLGPGGTLAAEVAAFSPTLVKRLVLVAPFGLYDEPTPAYWRQRGTFPRAAGHRVTSRSIRRAAGCSWRIRTLTRSPSFVSIPRPAARASSGGT